MAEEHRCEAPEGHRLCANNCGFFGSSATMNLCSKCYRDVCLKEQQQASIKSTVENSLSASSPSSSSETTGSLSLSLSSSSETTVVIPEAAGDVRLPTLSAVVPEAVATAEPPQPQANRCFSCRKRVGLTGFRCKCGTTFCGVHRYPEKHACTFDFKKVGREEIARANPIVKAGKLDKI